MQKRVCNKCKKEKALDCFYLKKGGKYGRGSVCKLCRSIYARAYHAVDKDRKSIILNGVEHILPEDVWNFMWCLEAEKEYFRSKWMTVVNTVMRGVSEKKV